MTLWTLELERSDVLSVFQNTHELYSVDQIADAASVRSPSNGGVVFVWDCPPLSIRRPPVIVVPRGDSRDFLAWASTFLSQMRPFTAFSRVVEIDTFTRLQVPSSPSIRQELEPALAGLVVSELLAYGARGLHEITPLMCSSTFFFSFARALAVGIPSRQIRTLYTDWCHLRQLTGSPLREAGSSIECLQSILIAMARKEDIQGSKTLQVILDACEQIAKQDHISEDAWAALVEREPDLLSAQKDMRASRERRVKLIDRLATQPFYGLEPAIRSFIVGYLVCLFDHGEDINLQLVPHSPDRSSVLMWYGFLAGLRRGTLLESAGESLGRRIVRDFLHGEAFFEAPRTDIALDELLILLDGPRRAMDFRTGAPNFLRVEIAPRVAATMRWPQRGRDGLLIPEVNSEEVREQRELFEGPSPKDRAQLLRELTQTVEQTHALLEQLKALPLDGGSARRVQRRRS